MAPARLHEVPRARVAHEFILCGQLPGTAEAVGPAAAGTVGEIQEIRDGVAAAGLREVPRAGETDIGDVAHGEAAVAHLNRSAARGVAEQETAANVSGCGDGCGPAVAKIGVAAGGRQGPVAPVCRHRPVVQRNAPVDICPGGRRRQEQQRRGGKAQEPDDRGPPAGARSTGGRTAGHTPGQEPRKRRSSGARQGRSRSDFAIRIGSSPK